MVLLHFKDGQTARFDTADHLASYPQDAELTAVLTNSNVVVAVVPTNNLEYADIVSA